MSCSYRIADRQTDVLVYGGNKQRKTKFEKNVMTDLLIIRFGEPVQHACVKFFDTMEHYIPVYSKLNSKCIFFKIVIGSVRSLEGLCMLYMKSNPEFYSSYASLMSPMVLNKLQNLNNSCDFVVVYPYETYSY